MTRLAYGIDALGGRPARSAARTCSTEAAIEAEVATFRNARLWDYRPLGDTLDQLQRIRRYYDFDDVDTDRYMIDDVQRQVMLSARELDLDQNPAAAGFVNQRIVYTHGIGAAHGAGQRGRPTRASRGCSSATCRRSRPTGRPRSPSRASTSARSRADYVITGARQAEFDYPTGEGRGRSRPGHRDALDAARPASASTRPCRACCSRCASATSTCSSATRSPPRASSCSIARWRTGSTTSRRSCATTRIRTSSSATTAR